MHIPSPHLVQHKGVLGSDFLQAQLAPGEALVQLAVAARTYPGKRAGMRTSERAEGETDGNDRTERTRHTNTDKGTTHAHGHNTSAPGLLLLQRPLQLLDDGPLLRIALRGRCAGRARREARDLPALSGCTKRSGSAQARAKGQLQETGMAEAH